MEVNKVISWLSEVFPIRDLGELKFFLGIQVCRGSYGLHLSQTQYLGNLLKTNDMENLRPGVTPMIANLDLLSGEEPIENAKEYCRIINSLQYMILTRSDIQFTVNQLSQFMASLRPIHWTTVKRMLRYLSRTPRYGILLRKMVDYNITTFCDANWGDDTVDRKSITSYLIYFRGALVFWVSRKQNTVAQTNTEAEYRAIATMAQEIETVRSALFDVQVTRPMKILTENQGVSLIAHNPIGHIQLKHVALDLHFVRECTEQGDLIIQHIPETKQWPDILTKALTPKAFDRLQPNLIEEPP